MKKFNWEKNDNIEEAEEEQVGNWTKVVELGVPSDSKRLEAQEQ